MIDGETQHRIAALEEQAMQRERDILALSSRVTQILTHFSCVDSDFSRLSSAVDALRADISSLKAAPAPDAMTASRLNSVIVASLPPISAEFRDKTFKLLWRGSRDGFGADDFHARCDGHAGTVTLVLDTAGNIFGGFTPVAWDSLMWVTWKGDESLRSFVFSIRNPHGIGARTFGLRADKKGEAIDCSSGHGPSFFDIEIADGCNATAQAYLLGTNYMNDTGIAGDLFFTGIGAFTVREIEVFELVN
jgi:hypothetical protein